MFKKIGSLFASKEFIRFVVVGGFAAGINFSSRIFFSLYFSFSLAVILAYCVGMLTAYLLSKFFVFSASKHHAAKEAVYFIVVNMVAIMQTWGISMLLYYNVFYWLQFNYYNQEIAHLIGIMFPVFSSYLGHKYFTFNASNH